MDEIGDFPMTEKDKQKPSHLTYHEDGTGRWFEKPKPPTSEAAKDERYDLCDCGCGDAKVECKTCEMKSGHRHRFNHVCTSPQKSDSPASCVIDLRSGKRYILVNGERMEALKYEEALAKDKHSDSPAEATESEKELCRRVFVAMDNLNPDEPNREMLLAIEEIRAHVKKEIVKDRASYLSNIIEKERRQAVENAMGGG